MHAFVAHGGRLERLGSSLGSADRRQTTHLLVIWTVTKSMAFQLRMNGTGCQVMST
jgi:hypothetical protein